MFAENGCFHTCAGAEGGPPCEGMVVRNSGAVELALIWRLSGAVVTTEIAGAEMNLGL